MQSRRLYKITPLLLMIGSIPCTQFLFSCSTFVVDPQIASHDEQSWEHAIEYISNCKHPTIFLTWKAAYFYQQAANLYFSCSQNAIRQGHTYEKDEYKFQDLIFLVNNSAWMYKTSQPGPYPGSFDLRFDICVNKELGYNDIIAESKTDGVSVDPTKGNNMLVTNLQDFNLELDDYDESKSDYAPYDAGEPGGDYGVAKILDKIFDIYDEFNDDLKFNIVACDFLWDEFTSNMHKARTNELCTLTRTLQKVDKIYLLSDGSYTWQMQHKNYLSYRKQNGYYTAKQQQNLWEKITKSNIEIARKYCHLIDQFVFYNNEKYYYHFSPSSTATYAPCLLDESSYVTKESTYKFSSPWFVPDSYSVIFGGKNTFFENYLKSYLMFFKYDYDLKPKFSSMLDPDTVNNFDPNKKNLIFLLPGEFRKDRCDDRVLNECSKILAKINQNFPNDKWNYIYKAHPQMKFVDVKELLQKLWHLSDLPNNSLIIDPVYPFEYLVTLDQWMVNNGIEEHYHLIDPSTLGDDEPSGILSSFDMLTTSIYAIMSMFAHEYNIPWSNVKHIVNSKAFYVPTKFSVESYEYDSNLDWSPINIKRLWDAYMPMCQNNEFPDINMFSVFDEQ